MADVGTDALCPAEQSSAIACLGPHTVYADTQKPKGISSLLNNIPHGPTAALNRQR